MKVHNDGLGSECYPEEDGANSSDEKLDHSESEDCCTICLQPMSDRTVIPKCSHEFCFECLLHWTELSCRCPLCSQNIGGYLIHSIRSRYDYRKRYLPPLQASPCPLPGNALVLDMRQSTQRRRQDRVWGRGDRWAADESDRLERSISKRRWIYEYKLYAKHVASNAYTKYRPYPTPAQFAASQDLISRTATFLRRELQVWQSLDVEFLTTLIISLMKSIDIRSESAVKLISEFLDIDESGGSRRNAEHFTHEVYSYVRSPHRNLFVYDTVVQYDSPPSLSHPADNQRNHRWDIDSQPSYLRLYDDRSRSPGSRGRRSSLPLSARSPSRGQCLEGGCRVVSPTEEQLERGFLSHSRHQDRDSNIGAIRRVDFSGTPTIRKTSHYRQETGQVECTNEFPSENAKKASVSGRPDLNIHATGEIIVDQAQLQSLHDPQFDGSRDLKLTRTGSPHGTTETASLEPLSDPEAPSLLSRLSDPHIPSIVLHATSGPPSPEMSMTALDTTEAHARLRARLNREKMLHAYESSQHAQPSSLDLEGREANLKFRARLSSRSAVEKHAVSVSESS